MGLASCKKLFKKKFHQNSSLLSSAIKLKSRPPRKGLVAQWQRGCLATRRPWVQIPPSPFCARKKNHACVRLPPQNGLRAKKTEFKARPLARAFEFDVLT